MACKHPPQRLYTWVLYDQVNPKWEGLEDILCIGCCDCGEAWITQPKFLQKKKGKQKKK